MGELEQAIELACGHAPVGCEVVLFAENGAAYVQWHDENGNIHDIDGTDQTLAKQFLQALEECIDHAQERALT